MRHFGYLSASDTDALFDAGYLTETYKQIAMLRGERQFADRARTIAGVVGSTGGTAMINRAIAQRPVQIVIPACCGIFVNHSRVNKLPQIIS